MLGYWKEGQSSLFLVMLLVSSTVISPLSTADEGTTFDEPPPEVESSEQIRSYPGTDNEVSSGYVQLKLDWINDGFPGRVDALQITQSRSAAKSCSNAHQELSLIHI